MKQKLFELIQINNFKSIIEITWNKTIIQIFQNYKIITINQMSQPENTQSVNLRQELGSAGLLFAQQTPGEAASPLVPPPPQHVTPGTSIQHLGMNPRLQNPHTESPLPQDLNKQAIFQLLKRFKLQQYANRMCQLGYAKDIYKLAFLSHRERDELNDALNMLPGHRERMSDLFKIIEQLNPKNQLKSALKNALRACNSKAQRVGSHQGRDLFQNQNTDQKLKRKSSRRENRSNSHNKAPRDSDSSRLAEAYSLMSHNSKPTNRYQHQTSSLTAKPSSTTGTHQIAYQGSKISNSTFQSSNHNNAQAAGGVSEPGHMVIMSDHQGSSIVQTQGEKRRLLLQEQRFQQRQSTNMAARSLSKGKRKEREVSDSLGRLYNQLDSKAKFALNQAFLINIKSGRNHQSFHHALDHYVNQSLEKKKVRNAIDQIFPPGKFLKNQQVQQQKQVARAYLKHTESSIQKKNIEKMNGAQQKKKSLSRERQNTGSQQRTALTAQKPQVNSQLSSEASLGMGPNLQNRPRPPLGMNNALSAQKSQRKKPNPFPAFIQTNARSAGLGMNSDLLPPESRNPTFLDSKGAKSAKSGAPPHQLDAASGAQRQKNSSSINQSNNNATISVGGGTSLANRSSSHHHYEKYETPEKHSSGIAGNVALVQQSTGMQKSAAGTRKQRMRSSCQSQSKLLSGAGAKTGLLPSQRQIEKVGVSQGQDTSVKAQNADLEKFVRKSGPNDSQARLSRQGGGSKAQTKPFFHQRNTSAKGPRRPPIRGPRHAPNSSSKPDPNFRQLLSNRQILRESQQKLGGSDSRANMHAKPTTQRVFNLNESSIEKSSNQKSVAKGARASSQAPNDYQSDEPQNLNLSQLQAPGNQTHLGQFVDSFEKLNHTVDNAGNQQQRSSQALKRSSQSKQTVDCEQTTSQQTKQSSQNIIQAASEENKAHLQIQDVNSGPGQTPNYSTPGGIEEVRNNQLQRTSEDGSQMAAPTVESKEESDSRPQDLNQAVEPQKPQLHAINDLSSPLLRREEQIEAMNYGHSFNSKRMAMAPAFFNLRIICDCLGRAIRRHIDFSQGHWFLDQLNEAKKERKQLKRQLKEATDQTGGSLEESGCSNATAFSYQFKDELKLTTTKKERGADAVDEEDFDRNDLDNLEDHDIQVEATEGGTLRANAQEDFLKIQKSLAQGQLRAGGEGDGAQKEVLFASKNNRYSHDQDGADNFDTVELPVAAGEEPAEGIDSIDDVDIDIQKKHFAIKEQQKIEEIRRDELLRKLNSALEDETKEKDPKQNAAQKPTQDQNQQAKNKSYIQMQLIEKDKKIKELTKMVRLYETGQVRGSGVALRGPVESIQEVMVINGASPTKGKPNNDEEDLMKKYSDDMYKMSRADFIMSQIDLEPIESNYSQEQQQVSSNNNLQTQAGLGLSNQTKQLELKNLVGSGNPNQNLDTDGQQCDKKDATPKDGGQLDDTRQNMDQIDGSFNSVSHGRSLNQSGKSGENGDGGHGARGQASGASDPFADDGMMMQLHPVAQTQPKERESDQTPDQKAINQPDKKQRESEKRPPKKKTITKEGNQDAPDREEQLQVLSEHVRFFDERLEFDNERFHRNLEVVDPSAEDIAAYGKYVTIASKMENEAPIIALVYIERILAKTGLLVNKYNWKRILLVCMCVASKVWDDDSLENVHFPKVMADVTFMMINRLEKVFLDYLLNYDLVVKGSEYAKYYFIMRTLANELRDESLSAEERSKNARKKRKDRDDWAEFPLRQPISADQMLLLQRNAAKAEIYLKDRHEKEMILAIADKFKGDQQKIREKKFLTTGNYVSKKSQHSEHIEGMLSSTM